MVALSQSKKSGGTDVTTIDVRRNLPHNSAAIVDVVVVGMMRFYNYSTVEDDEIVKLQHYGELFVRNCWRPVVCAGAERVVACCVERRRCHIRQKCDTNKFPSAKHH